MISPRLVSVHGNRPPSRATRLYQSMLEHMSESAVLWRSMAMLFFAGGVLALISIALPLNEHASRAAVVGLAVTAITSAAFMWLMARRLAHALMSPLLAFGTLLVTLAVVAQQSSAAVYALMYVWVGFEAFFFLRRRQAWFHIALTAVAYAAALAVTDGGPPDAAARWLITIGTVLIVGVLAGALHDRAELLIRKLADVARTDALTGLLNRRGFEERMELELERANRTGSPVAVLVGDLDHFKLVNDRHGHRAGDVVLQRFAELALAVKRRIDEMGRVGGEEFALILPETDEHGAYLLAERLRRATRDGLHTDDGAVTVSFGVAASPRHGTTAGHLLHAADQALYLAKQLGRDRSVLYSDEVASALDDSRDGVPQPVEQIAAVLILAETLDLRDTGTALHSQTVGRYAEQIAIELGLDPAHVERVRLAGLLHDVGKIGVADPILRKPGPLDEHEWAEMRKHPELGARILAGANLDDISAWVLAHHERPDGFGYPAQLAGEAIPLEARILSVADSYEAMTSDRVYRPGMPREEALAELRRCAGTQFDERVVAAFVAVLERSAAPAPAV